MKYADCPTISTSITVQAPTTVVWPIVSNIESPTRFSTEVAAVEWLDPERDEPALGARFTGNSAHDAIGEWRTTCEITGLESGRRFEWSVLGADDTVSSVWCFTLSDHPDGVQLELRFQMGPGRSGLNAAIDHMPDKEDRIVERRLDEHRANMERTLTGIRALAEQRHAENR